MAGIETADLQAIWLTIKLAGLTTVILLFVATPLSWWLCGLGAWYKKLVSALVLLPLVLPPTVLGFYLLIVLGPQGIIGKAAEALGAGRLPFTFTGLVIGSVIFSLPFAVQPIQNAFETIGKRPLEVAATLRANPWDRFFSVALPLAKPGFLTTIVLVFSHTVGEFGVVLMLGGNIPGQTQVLSVSIYNHVEALEYKAAYFLSAGMVLFSLVFLLALMFSNYKGIKKGF